MPDENPASSFLRGLILVNLTLGGGEPDGGGEGHEIGGGDQHPAAETKVPGRQQEMHDPFDHPHGEAGGDDENDPEGQAAEAVGIFDGIGGHVPADDEAGDAADHGGEEEEDIDDAAFGAKGMGDEVDEDPGDGDEAHFSSEHFAVILEAGERCPLIHGLFLRSLLMTYYACDGLEVLNESQNRIRMG